jgi:ribosome maturation factor RimP
MSKNDVMDNSFKNTIVNALESKAAQFADRRGLNLLRIDVRGAAAAPVIEVLLDGNRLVSIDDCEVVSKELNDAIESDSLVKGNYRLDVMSPGMDEPLVHDWQFERSIGRLVEVHYEDQGEHHTLHGHLRESGPKEIAIEPIHIKGAKPQRQKQVVTEDGPVDLKPDEQIYDDPVALVKVARSHIKKVLVQPEFGR